MIIDDNKSMGANTMPLRSKEDVVQICLEPVIKSERLPVNLALLVLTFAALQQILTPVEAPRRAKYSLVE